MKDFDEFASAVRDEELYVSCREQALSQAEETLRSEGLQSTDADLAETASVMYAFELLRRYHEWANSD